MRKMTVCCLPVKNENEYEPLFLKKSKRVALALPFDNVRLSSPPGLRRGETRRYRGAFWPQNRVTMLF
ncbi:hypothetical protein CH063_03231 [Colletotrichum higginsianum]|uniref:Uncharacterized protein n=1 Tax=Colletotrichum higginsianum (strain IMI 349063) TaxID=759273 RepID=H1VV21_COLHI|nr:hypothetical protein CH063_03231 [Colletotrichum higginsianum]